MKPLEPGCLALVISGEDIGMVVTCVCRREAGFQYRVPGDFNPRTAQESCWITDDPDFDDSTLRPESSLLRIDGGEPESVETQEDMEVRA